MTAAPLSAAYGPLLAALLRRLAELPETHRRQLAQVLRDTQANLREFGVTYVDFLDTLALVVQIAIRTPELAVEAAEWLEAQAQMEGS